MKKIFITFLLVFLLNSCFWYKLVKIEEEKNDSQKQENVEKKYIPWSIWERLHKARLEGKNSQEKIKEEEKNNKEDSKQEEKNLTWSLEKENKEENKEKNFSFSQLSEIKNFWEPIKKANWVISSKNYNLFIFKDNSPILENIDKDNLKEFFTYHKDKDVEDLTNFISNSYNIFYRNTARTIQKNKWFTYFVIHENNWNYIYEKHYIDLKNKLHWILFLDKWSLGEVKNIKEKLEKLKQKNSELKQIKEFSEIPSANKIFLEIVNKKFWE